LPVFWKLNASGFGTGRLDLRHGHCWHRERIPSQRSGSVVRRDAGTRHRSGKALHGVQPCPHTFSRIHDWNPRLQPRLSPQPLRPDSGPCASAPRAQPPGLKEGNGISRTAHQTASGFG